MKHTLHLICGISVTFRMGDCAKIAHGTVVVATKAAYAMEQKTGEPFDVYRCRWCDSWHIGHSRH